MGARSATISVADDATGSPQVYTFNGTGTLGPAVGFNPASPLNLGSVDVGNTGVPQLIELVNTGTTTLNIGALTLGGSNPGDFIVTDTCTGAAIAVGGNCTISATLSPTTSGPLSMTVSVASDATSTPDVYTLNGNGGTISPVVLLNPTSLSFGNVSVGDTSIPELVQLTNTGTTTLNVGGITIIGTDAARYAPFTDTCSNQAIAPNGSCILQVTFSPDSATTFNSANLNIPSDASSSPDSVALTGTELLDLRCY